MFPLSSCGRPCRDHAVGLQEVVGAPGSRPRHLGSDSSRSRGRTDWPPRCCATGQLSSCATRTRASKLCWLAAWARQRLWQRHMRQMRQSWWLQRRAALPNNQPRNKQPRWACGTPGRWSVLGTREGGGGWSRHGRHRRHRQPAQAGACRRLQARKCKGDWMHRQPAVHKQLATVVGVDTPIPLSFQREKRVLVRKVLPGV